MNLEVLVSFIKLLFSQFNNDKKDEFVSPN